MNARLYSALREIAEYLPHQGYYWRKKSMEDLAEMGLVERHPNPSPPYSGAYRITPAGRAKLAEMENKPTPETKA